MIIFCIFLTIYNRIALRKMDNEQIFGKFVIILLDKRSVYKALL